MAERARPRRHRRTSRRKPKPRRGAGRRVRHAGARTARRSYVRLDVDLVRESFQRGGPGLLHRIEAVFREREVVEVEGLLRPAAHVLHALSSRGFSHVDHWEVQPGGWLPLPEPAHERLEEPVGHLLNALRSEAWGRVADARSFAARLSGPEEMRADVTVRRVHRERGHAITVELVGSVSERELRGVERALRAELAVVRLKRTAASPFGTPRS